MFVTVYLSAVSFIFFETAYHETMVSLATNLSFQLWGGGGGSIIPLVVSNRVC